MRKLLFSFALLALAAPAHAQAPAQGTDHGIGATWIRPVNQIDCSSTVSKSCLLGYTETITPPVGVAGSNVIANCALTGSPSPCIAASATNYAWAPVPGPLYCGQWSVSLVANYLDASGNPTASSAISATVTEPCPFVPVPPTGLGVTLTP